MFLHTPDTRFPKRIIWVGAPVMQLHCFFNTAWTVFIDLTTAQLFYTNSWHIPALLIKSLWEVYYKIKSSCILKVTFVATIISCYSVTHSTAFSLSFVWDLSQLFAFFFLNKWNYFKLKVIPVCGKDCGLWLFVLNWWMRHAMSQMMISHRPPPLF